MHNEDNTFSNDEVAIRKAMEDAGEKALRIVTEMSKFIPKRKEQLKVELSTGPKKDIANVAELLKSNPKATDAQIRSVIIKGPHIQAEKKLWVGKAADKMARLNGYMKTVKQEAGLQVIRDNMKEKYGQDIFEKMRQTQSQKQSQSQGQGY